jgi:hypothetical protein
MSPELWKIIVKGTKEVAIQALRKALAVPVMKKRLPRLLSKKLSLNLMT